MRPDTAIFDMDGLLIDSEPLWHEAAIEALQVHGASIDAHQYAGTVGLRTKEFLQHWFEIFGIDMAHSFQTEENITRLVIEKVKARGQLLPGARQAVQLLRSQGLKIGLATSSPLSLVDAFFEMSGMASMFDQIASAEHLAYGKPHPQVYLDCIRSLGSAPVACICFEDSFNGMLAAKSARSRCIVIPAPDAFHKECWGAADKKLTSLEELTLDMLWGL